MMTLCEYVACESSRSPSESVAIIAFPIERLRHLGSSGSRPPQLLTLSCLLFAMVCLGQQPGTIVTIAGNGNSTYSGDGGSATNAALSRPLAVAVDNSGNVYIADRSNNRVRKVDPNGVISTIAGTDRHHYNGDDIPATSATLSAPTAVAIDSTGNVYIADDAHLRVRKISPNGIITTFAGGQWGDSGDGGPAIDAQFKSLTGVAVDSFGNVYIVDSNNGRVRKVDPAGVITAFAGSGRCCNRGDGGPALQAYLSNPTGVATDAAGNVYIVDTYGVRGVRKVTLDGIITTIAGTGQDGYYGDGGPATSARLFWPRDVAVDDKGNVFIADTGNSSIRKVDANGTISTFAGIGKRTYGYAGDGGPATSAEFRSPNGIAVDGAGNVYIADTYNHRVRKVFASQPTCEPPTITSQPWRQTVGNATTVSSFLSVGVVGSPLLLYQWYQGARGDTSVPVGSNSLAFALPSLTAPATYWVRVTNTCGSIDSSAVQVLPMTCGPIELRSGQDLVGILDPSCLSARRPGRHFNTYSFSATAGDRIAVSMNSDQFDTYMYLIDPSGSVAAADDDGGGGSNSRIAYTALTSGTYSIEATSYGAGATGPFTLELAVSSGGTNVECSPRSITAGQVVTASLTIDCPSSRRLGRYGKLLTFTANIGDAVTVRMDSSRFDTYLLLLGPDQSILSADDDGGQGTNSRIQVTAPTSGLYTIEATSYEAGVVGDFELTLGLVASEGSSPSLPESPHPYPNNYDRTWTYSAPMTSATTSITFDPRTYVEEHFDYIHILDEAGRHIQGSPFTGRELAGATIVVPGNAFSLRLTSDENTSRWGFRVTNVSHGSDLRKLVFLVHGISQGSGSLAVLKRVLTQSADKIDAARFEVDDGFVWSCAIERSGNCENASISDGARALAAYIAQKAESRPTTPIIIIGYSMGGLIARDMMLNNYDGVLNQRRVALLVTLGTPHLGYPYIPIDELAKPPGPSRQMAGDFRLEPLAPSLGYTHYMLDNDNEPQRVTLSSYLFELNTLWSSMSFIGNPTRWIAAAGQSCPDPTRGVSGRGCPDANEFSDGVVCAQSAAFKFRVSNGPTSTWEDPDGLYTHTNDWKQEAVLCSGSKPHFITMSQLKAGCELAVLIVEAVNAVQ